MIKFKYISIVLMVWVVTLSENMFAQQVEVFAGANRNIFHDYSSSAHRNSVYHLSSGFCTGVAIDNIRMDWLKLRLTLQFDRYDNNFEVTDGGQGGTYTTDATVNKSIISLGIYPVNFQILKRIDFNMGLIISRLVHESFKGTYNMWTVNSSGTPADWSYNLQDKYDRYSASTYYGFQGRLAYRFNLSKSISIVPQYLFYFGLSNEFVAFPEDTKAIRHSFCIGIRKEFGAHSSS